MKLRFKTSQPCTDWAIWYQRNLRCRKCADTLSPPAPFPLSRPTLHVSFHEITFVVSWCCTHIIWLLLCEVRPVLSKTTVTQFEDPEVTQQSLSPICVLFAFMVIYYSWTVLVLVQESCPPDKSPVTTRHYDFASERLLSFTSRNWVLGQTGASQSGWFCACQSLA